MDPPRCGLHKDVTKALRKHATLERLVYVSCNLGGARQNIVDLCREESKKHGGAPFRLLSATPIDLFPHTSHCEVVLMFGRGGAL